jgi:hypothetical protein
MENQPPALSAAFFLGRIFISIFPVPLFRRFTELEVQQCPFVNLPDVHKGPWGRGRTAADMLKCRWLKPRLVAAIELLEGTPVDYGTQGLSQ